MRLVDEHEKILREVVEQGVRRRASRAAGEHAGVVLHAGAEAHLAQHLEVVARALLDALCLNQLALTLKEFHPLGKLVLDFTEGFLPLVVGDGVVRRGENDGHVQLAYKLAGQHIDLGHTVDLVAEKLHAHRLFALGGGEDLHRVAPHAELATHKADIVALVGDQHEAAEQLLALHRHAAAQHDLQLLILGRVAQAVDAGDAGDDDDIPPLKERARRAVAQLVDFVVDHRVLLDVHVLAGDVRLGLVVVVVGDEVFHRVVREELAELGAELGGKRLVVRQHQGRAVDVGDDVCHREGLARAGHAQQRLLGQPRLHACGQLRDRVGLVAGRFIGCAQVEFVILHSRLLSRGSFRTRGVPCSRAPPP